MNLRIRTKWGQIQIDPERIFEVRVIINPWDNVYNIEFILDRSYEKITAKMESISELSLAMNRVENELQFVKQYKYRDQFGQLQIDEPRRLSLRRQREQ